MDFSEKPQIRRPRVIHGPHRIRVSGVAVAAPELPVENVVPTYIAGDTELAGNIVEFPMEFVTIAGQSQQK